MKKFYLAAKHLKKLFLLFSFLMLAFWAKAATITSNVIVNGNWNATSTWVGGVVPTSSDNVVIVAGAIVTMDVNFISNVGATVTVNGRITFNKNDNFALTINGTINLNAANNSITSATGGNTNNFFNLSSGATLITPNVTGIIGGGCAIQQSGNGFTANLNPGANYQFNGTANQATLGLPATVNSLTVNNGSGVKLTAPVSVTTFITIGNITPNSIFYDNGKQITSTGTINLTSGTFNVGTGAANTSFPAFTANNILAGTTVNYNSSAAQTIAAVNYGNLTNIGNGPRTLASSGTIGVKNTFTPSTNASSTITGSTVDFNGTTAQTIPAFNYNNLTVTNTNTNITLAGSGIISIAGTFTPNATSFGTITNSTVSFNGTVAQTIPSFTFNNLTINNSAGISSIGGDITVNQTLQLSSGIVTTGSSKIIIPSGGSSNTGGGWIYGNLQKYFSASSNTNTFQVGGSIAGTYRPVTVNFTSVTTPGYLTVSQIPNAGSQPAIASVALSPYLTPYWNLTSAGVAGIYDATFTFVSGDGATATTVAEEYTGGAWNTTNPGSRTTLLNQVTGLDTFGDFVFGTTTGIPQVTTQPSNVPICSTTTTTSFTAASTSKPTPTVKWQRSLDGGTTWVDITANLDAGVTYSGFTTNTLTLTGTTTLSGQTNYKYRPIYTNLNGSSTNAVAATLTVTPAPSATISYTSSPYAANDNTSYTPSLTGTTGGTFTASGGLIINSSTGAITPSANAAGTYTVTYTIVAAGGCSQFQTTASLTITLAPTVDISYVSNPFCQSVTPAQPVTFSNGQGSWMGGSFSPVSGLTLNTSTGEITPGTSTPGTYNVTYNIPAAPPYPASTTTTQVTITAVPTASISYTGGPFCSSDQTPDPVTLTGTGAYMGGIYTASPSSLVIDATSGAITPFGSTGNTYTITYTTLASGGCSVVTATTSVTIVTRPTATVSYTSSSFCQSIASAPATVTGTSGGTFSASPAGLIINAGTGTITPGTSTPGDYIVTYTIPPSGPCGQVQITTNVTIVASPTGSIDYPNQPYCQTGGTKSVTLTGTDNYTGGTYSSAPGLTINAATGDITPSSSTPGTYAVSYTTPNCPVTFTTTVEIDAAPTAAISYANAPFCQSDGSLKPVTLTGDNSGTFSAPSGLSIDQNSGSITPSTSTPGTYLISYTIPAQGSCSAVTVTTLVTITALPTANISYAGTPFCTSISTPQPVTLSGTNAYTGGTYSSTPGLIISSTNGSITPNTSTPGTYTVTYTITATGGCAAVPATTQVVITAVPTATITYSGPFCISDAASYTVNLSGTGAYSGGTFSSSPAGLSVDASGTITPSLSTAGTFTVTYTIPASAGCSSVQVSTSVIINADATIALTSAATTTSQTPCINTAIVNITYAIGGSGTGATVTGLPSNVTGTYNLGTKIFTISGTPNVAGPFSFTVTTTGPCINNLLSGTINVNANSTIALTSATATTSQTPCINTAITNITYSIGGGGTGVAFSGLPANVTGSFSGGVATITGTPNVTGTYTYTVTTTGPCINTFLSGTIMVKPDATITLTSVVATTSQTTCINTAITPITYSIGGGGTGVTFSGLPANVNGSFSGGVATISGTPNISGTFNYTVNTTGTCVQTSASGTITISSVSVGGTASANQIICQNTVPADLTLAGKTGTVVEWQKASDPNFTTTITHYSTNSTTLPGSTIGTLSTTSYFRAVDTSGSCSSAFSTVVVIAVNPPFTPVIDVSPSTTICYGQSVTLSTKGFNSRDTIVGGDFSDPNPTGWTGQNGNASNNNTNVDIIWGYTNSGHQYAGKTYSSSGGSFMITNGNVTSILTTPSFSTVGRTSLSLQWNKGYSFNGTGNGKVEISINGGTTWITLATYNSSSPVVTTNPFTSNPIAIINLSAYLGQPTVKIRYNFIGTGTTSTWAIDNVDVVGPYQPVTYTWPAGFTVSGNGASATITPPVGTNTYTISTATGGCAATTTSVTITVNPTPAITAIPTKTCSGTAFIVTPQNGTNGTVPAGTTYTWTTPVSSPIGAVTGGSAQATGQTSISQTLTNTTNAPATLTYTVTPLSGTCSGASFNVTVTVNPLPTALISVSTPNNTCYGTTTTILIEGTANATVTYTINGVAQSTPVTLNASGKANLTTGLITSPTTYTLTGVTSASPAGCFKSLSSSVTITVTSGTFTWTGNTSTDWNTAGNWCSGTLPTSTSAVTIPLAGVTNFPVISAGENAFAASVTVAGGASLTMSGSGNLTITSGGTFSNSGTFSASGTGAVIFAGTGTISGTTGFNNVTINGAVDFGTASTVTGRLLLNTNGTASGATTHLVTYTSTSTLIYNETVTIGNEWYQGGPGTVTPGAGVPQNVIIQSGTVTIPNAGGTNRALAGNLDISSGTTLQFAAGNSRDLYIAGNWTNNGGTFTANGRKVTFDAVGTVSSPVTQTLSGTTTFYDLTFGNSFVTTDFGSSTINILDNLRNDAGSMNGNASTINFNGASGLILGTASKYFYNLLINTNVADNVSSTGDIHVYNSFTNNAIFSQLNTHTIYFDKSGGTENLSGVGATTFGKVTIGGPNFSSPTTLNANALNFTVTGGLLNFTVGSIFNGNAGTVTFSTISSTVSGTGTANFYDAITNVSLNPGSGISTINHNLQINPGGSVSTYAPNYGSVATLTYNTGVSGLSTALEWNANTGTPGIGQPDNVTVLNNAVVLPTASGSRTVAGLLTINTGSFLSINNNNNLLTVSGGFAGTGSLRGGNLSNLTAGGNGTMYFDAGANYLKNLTANSGANLFIGNPLNITGGTGGTFGSTSGILTVNGTLNTGGYLTLKSNSDGDAIAGQSTGTPIINGNVIVERYIPRKRAWRFLSVTTNSIQTINAAWQEGGVNTGFGPFNTQDPNLGFGTEITYDNLAAHGFDFNTTYNPSIKVWDANNNDWSTIIPYTNSTLINTNPAYCLFVRGSRAVDLSLAVSAPADNTVLRTIGSLNYGNVTRQYNIVTNNGVLVANPYASPINMLTVLSANGTNFYNQFAIWDPQFAGSYNVGGYRYYSAGWQAPGVGGYTGGTYAQSGQAFMLTASNTANNVNVNFKESNKVSTSNEAIVFDKITRQSHPAVYANLLTASGDSLAFVDGVTAGFGKEFSAGVDGSDARKFANFGENMILMRNGELLAIELRPLPIFTDTLFYKLYLKQQPYTLQIFGKDLEDMPGEAWLVDKYLNIKTAVNLYDTASYNFTPVVNADGTLDTNSYRNRFMLVFKRILKATPVATTMSSGGAEAVTLEGTVKVYPNPVVTSRALLKFNNMKAGKYEVTLNSLEGKNLSRKVIQHKGGNDNYSIPLSARWAAGDYFVKISDEKGYSITTKLVIAK